MSKRIPLLAWPIVGLVAVAAIGTAVSVTQWRRSAVNERAFAESITALRAKAESARQHEQELETQLGSIEREQAAILAACDSEQELIAQVEATRVEIDAKLAIAREQIAEAMRLLDLSRRMQAEKKDLESKPNQEKLALLKREAFANTDAQRLADFMKLASTVRRMPRGRALRSVVQQRWANFAEFYQPLPGQWDGLGWEYVNRCVSRQTSLLLAPELDLARDVVRVVADRPAHKLLFLRKTRFAELKQFVSERNWTSQNLDLRKIAGAPAVRGAPLLACFTADGANAVVYFSSSPANHELLTISTSGADAGALVARLEVPFVGDVHSLRFAANGQLYMIRSNHTSDDLELYGVSEKKILWSCRSSRGTEKSKESLLLPFFIECGTDPSEHLLFASSPAPGKADEPTTVFVHSVDMRNEPVVASFDCGQQLLAQWPHVWQLSEYHFLGVGKRLLATTDPPLIQHPRFDVGKSLEAYPIQAFTNRWSALLPSAEAPPAGEFLEADLYLPNAPPEGRIIAELRFSPLFDSTAGRLLYFHLERAHYYDVFDRQSFTLPLRYDHPTADHVVPLSHGQCLLSIDEDSVQIIRLANWEQGCGQSIETANARLKEVARRCLTADGQQPLLRQPSQPAE